MVLDFFVRISICGVLGVLGGVLSSEAMLQPSRSNAQGTLTFVPESNNSESNDMVLVRNDDEMSRLVADWNSLRRDFGTWLSGGGRSNFDIRLSRGLHPICQFIGKDVLLQVVNSSYRSELVGNEFFPSTENLINFEMRDKDGCINKKEISIQLIALFPKSVRDSIFADQVKTFEMEQELAVEKLRSERLVLMTQTQAEIDRIHEELEHLKETQKLEIEAKKSSSDTQRAIDELNVKMRELELRKEESRAFLEWCRDVLNLGYDFLKKGIDIWREMFRGSQQNSGGNPTTT